MIKTGISPDVAGYGPSDLNDFWRVINSPETGILNREMFLYMLSHEFSRAHRFHEMLTLAVFSVTFPKAADEMVAIEDVCQIIRAVEKVKREVDLFGHFGDRSFALLLPRVDSARTCVLVDRIHERLPEMVPTLAEAKPTIHFGLASAPADAATLSLLVKTAHANMQEAAGKGLHRLPVQQPPQQQTAPAQVQQQQPPAQPQPQPGSDFVTCRNPEASRNSAATAASTGTCGSCSATAASTGTSGSSSATATSAGATRDNSDTAGNSNASRKSATGAATPAGVGRK